MTATPLADSTDAATTPTLSSTPETAPVDAVVELVGSGFTPGQRVTLTATFADLGTEWQSNATYEADDGGRIDLTADAPVAGDYEDVRPMGLVQFAEQVGEGSVDLSAGADSYELEIVARVDSDVVASTTVTRRVAPGVERVRLEPEQEGIAGDVYVPEANGDYPGVVALHGSGGEPLGRKARVLASNGFVVLALRYFGGPAPVPAAFDKVPVGYVDEAVNYLHGRDDVAPGEVGVLGASRGTELAFLVANRRDDVGVCVAYAPSGYAWPGRCSDSSGPTAAWQVDDPLSVVPHPGPEAAQPEETERGIRMRSMFAACLSHADADALDAARIPVEDVAGDVTLLAGLNDGVWPADDMCEDIENAMASAPGTVATYRYADAGHSLLLPYHPTTERATTDRPEAPPVVNGGTSAGHADADRQSWQAALDALETLRD